MALVWADRVLEASVSVGTGPLALGGAITGYQAFAAECSIGDTAYAAAFAVDANGTPSGEWVSGLATYSADNELTFTDITGSSNGGAAVNFTPGTKWVMLTPTASAVSGFDPTAEIAAAIAAHVAAGDPHPAYALEANLGTAAAQNSTAFDAAGSASAAQAAAIASSAASLASHVADGDPHPAYALESALSSLATAAKVQPCGRLTLVSATPVLISDQTAKTAIYYTPFIGDTIPLYSGSLWANTTFAELTLNLDTSNHLSGALYDVFVWSDAGTVKIGTGPAWSSATARGTGAGTTELQRLNGTWTNKNSVTLKNGAGAGTAGVAANTATYVGTFYATANGQTGMAFKPAAAAGGSNAILGLFNAYNRTSVLAMSRDSTASWTYATTTWRAANNSASNRISYVDGLAGVTATATYQVLANGSGATSVVGVSQDSTTAAPGVTAQTGTPTTSTGITPSITEVFLPALGFHYLQAMEVAAGGTTTYYGAAAAPSRQLNSLVAQLMM